MEKNAEQTPKGTPVPPPTKAQPAIEYKSAVGAQDIRDAIAIKELDLFLITKPNGNVPRGNVDGLGLYFHDTRFLSAYELSLEGITPIYLLSTGRERFSLLQELTNPDLITPSGQHVPRQVVRIQRHRIIGPDLWEEITLANFYVSPLTLRLSLEFDADFRDMFEVRGLVTRQQGTLFPPAWTDGCVLNFRYDGVDGITRTTRVVFDPPPTSTAAGTAVYQLSIPAHGQAGAIRVHVTISPSPEASAPPVNLPTLIKERSGQYQQWLASQVGLSSDNAMWDDLIHRARFDLRLLMSRLDDFSYPSAGVP